MNILGLWRILLESLSLDKLGSCEETADPFVISCFQQKNETSSLPCALSAVVSTTGTKYLSSKTTQIDNNAPDASNFQMSMQQGGNYCHLTHFMPFSQNLFSQELLAIVADSISPSWKQGEHFCISRLCT